MCVELLDEHPVGVLLHGFQVGYVEYGCWQQPPPLPVHVEWLLDEGGLEAPHTLSVQSTASGEWNSNGGTTSASPSTQPSGGSPSFGLQYTQWVGTAGFFSL